MALERCPLQTICVHYTSGDNHPPNHHVRRTILCVKYIPGCEIETWWRISQGEEVACKVRYKK